MLPRALNAMLLEAAATSCCQSALTVPAPSPTALAEEEEADPQFMTPNVEVTGRRRMDALPARRRIDSERHAGKVASRWRSG
jgi:hypothetical protein